jgi:hypothetical protein
MIGARPVGPTARRRVARGSLTGKPAPAQGLPEPSAADP